MVPVLSHASGTRDDFKILSWWVFFQLWTYPDGETHLHRDFPSPGCNAKVALEGRAILLEHLTGIFVRSELWQELDVGCEHPSRQPV